MLAILGVLMVLTFLVLILSKKMTPFLALAIVPIVFALIAGTSVGNVGKFIYTGISGVLPVILVLTFSILYFALLTDAGFFDPLITRIIKWSKGDPAKLILGTGLIMTVINFSGDGTVTIMVCVFTLMPIFKKMGVSLYLLALCLAVTNAVLNIVPWGGPLLRVAAVLNLPSDQVFNPIVPAMVVGLIAVLIGLWFVGLRERKRIGYVKVDEAFITEMIESITKKDIEIKRPKLAWFNLIFLILNGFLLIKGIIPSPILFFLATIITLIVNYPSPKQQDERIKHHAESVMGILPIIISAGVLMGILNGTKMSDAMANYAAHIVPQAWGPHMPIITTILAMPGLCFLSNDGFYFGILPVLTKVAATFGVSSVAMARASMLGYAFHVISPISAPVYLTMKLLEIDYGTFAKKYIPWGLAIVVLLFGFTALLGYVPI